MPPRYSSTRATAYKAASLRRREASESSRTVRLGLPSELKNRNPVRRIRSASLHDCAAQEKTRAGACGGSPSNTAASGPGLSSGNSANLTGRQVRLLVFKSGFQLITHNSPPCSSFGPESHEPNPFRPSDCPKPGYFELLNNRETVQVSVVMTLGLNPHHADFQEPLCQLDLLAELVD